jgi:hypothetical protein
MTRSASYNNFDDYIIHRAIDLILSWPDPDPTPHEEEPQSDPQSRQNQRPLTHPALVDGRASAGSP